MCLQRFPPLFSLLYLTRSRAGFITVVKKRRAEAKKEEEGLFSKAAQEKFRPPCLNKCVVHFKQEIQEIKIMGPTVPVLIFLSSVYEYNCSFLFRIFKLHFTVYLGMHFVGS